MNIFDPGSFLFFSHLENHPTGPALTLQQRPGRGAPRREKTKEETTETKTNTPEDPNVDFTQR